MAILHVRHTTTYRYSRPVRLGDHRLMLRPRDSHDLRLISTNLNLSPSASIRWMHDVFGNSIAIASFAKPTTELQIESDLTLETFAIEPSGEFGTGPKVTIGGELAPGLVARFSRQFGQEQFDEAAIEYYLSRLFRLRATFSDAQSIVTRSTFRRVERAGIDLLIFFSF